MTESVRMTLAELDAFCRKVLLANGLSEAHAAAVARSITRAEADECYSHGIYRLPGYVASLRSGKAAPSAEPELSYATPVILRVDAKKTYAPRSVEIGLPPLIEAARIYGIAALAIHDCYHFSALWADIEPLAEAGLVCWAFTAGQCCVAPAGGTEALFGTNPMAFGWPSPRGRPYIFDFATSAAARGEIDLKRRAGEQLPQGWAVGPDGAPTTDPAEALKGALLPFGGHKGSALSMMVELIAAPLIGDLTSRQSRAVENGDGGPPLGGELILAMNPAAFGGDTLAERMGIANALFTSARQQQGVRLAADRRYAARQRTRAHGVSISAELFAELQALGG